MNAFFPKVSVSIVLSSAASSQRTGMTVPLVGKVSYETFSLRKLKFPTMKPIIFPIKTINIGLNKKFHVGNKTIAARFTQ